MAFLVVNQISLRALLRIPVLPCPCFQCLPLLVGYSRRFLAASQARVTVVVQPLALALGKRALLFGYLVRVRCLLGLGWLLVIVVLLRKQPFVQLFEVSWQFDCFEKLDFV